MYANARYDYSISYPANLLKQQPEPDAGDGVTFGAVKRPGGASLIHQKLNRLIGELLNSRILQAKWLKVLPLADGCSQSRGRRDQLAAFMNDLRTILLT